MKVKKLTAAMLVASVMMSGEALAANFTDIHGHWAEATINRLADKGVVNGVTLTSFNPEGTVTRAEFLKMAMEANGIKTVPYREGECLGASARDWFAPYLQSALDKGLIPSDMVGGYNVTVVSDISADGNVTSKALYSGAFGGNAAINREEMAVITQTMYQYSLNASTMKDMNAAANVEFTDKEEISAWAMQSIKLACAQGFIQGMEDGSFAPKATATRAQAATIISRVLGKVNR